MSNPILRRHYESMDQVPEAFLGLYTELTDGRAEINAIPGLVPAEAIEAIGKTMADEDIAHRAVMTDKRAKADPMWPRSMTGRSQ